MEISRFESEHFTDISFLRKIYTDNEIDYCLSKTPSSQHFAVRFAAKEAVIKCFREATDLNMKSIEIINTKGYPEVQIIGQDFSRIEISLSHSDNFAVAVALVIK